MREDFQKTPPHFDISVVPILLLDKEKKKKNTRKKKKQDGCRNLLQGRY